MLNLLIYTYLYIYIYIYSDRRVVSLKFATNSADKKAAFQGPFGLRSCWSSYSPQKYASSSAARHIFGF